MVKHLGHAVGDGRAGGEDDNRRRRSPTGYDELSNTYQRRARWLFVGSPAMRVIFENIKRFLK